MRPWIWLSPLITLACGPTVAPDEQPLPDLDVMADVLATLPSIAPDTEGARTFAPGDAVDDFLIVQRFGLECHWENENPGACPTGVPADLSTKYSTDRLLGLVAHAEMVTNEIFRPPGASRCASGGAWTPRTLDLGSFVSDDPGGDPTRFLVDAFDRFDCVSTGGARGTAWSVTDGKRYESITVTKGEASLGADASFVFQAVILLDGARRARVVAANAAGVTLGSGVSAMRSVVVANLTNRRFLVRTGGGPSGGMSGAGQGGVTVAGVREAGVWFARSAETPDGVCVDNPTLMAVDPTACAMESAAWADGQTPAAWLGLDAADAGVLDDWLALWSEGPATSLLADADAPSTAEDRADLPDRIE